MKAKSKMKSVTVTVNEQWIYDAARAAGYEAFDWFVGIDDDEGGDPATVEARNQVLLSPALNAVWAALSTPEIEGCLTQTDGRLSAVIDVVDGGFNDGWNWAVDDWRLRGQVPRQMDDPSPCDVWRRRREGATAPEAPGAPVEPEAAPTLQ
jgi:hypothetical protein